MADQQEFEPNPVDEDGDPEELFHDPDLGDMPGDLEPGSFEADPDDHFGRHDHPR